MSKKYELLNMPIYVGETYQNGMSLYRVEGREEDCLRPSLHLRRLKDGWEIDVVGAALYLTDRGVELKWEGSGVDEKGIDAATGNVLVEVDPKYFRPCEVEQLLGDPTKAKTLLGWNPTKTTFPELVRIMVEHDMKFVKKLHLKAQLDKE